MEKDIQTLQETVAHQQEDISRLSDELYTQQQEIAQLQVLVRALQSRIDQVANEATTPQGDAPEPPPPHY